MSIFALVILVILVAAVIAVWLALALWPGRIARSRNHSKAEAIAVCGYGGALTLGILMPVAFIWAYTESNPDETGGSPSYPGKSVASSWQFRKRVYATLKLVNLRKSRSLCGLVR